MGGRGDLRTLDPIYIYIYIYMVAPPIKNYLIHKTLYMSIVFH